MGGLEKFQKGFGKFYEELGKKVTSRSTEINSCLKSLIQSFAEILTRNKYLHIFFILDLLQARAYIV